ncbi:MAG: magnesium transporter [Hyphomonadaceae bacterium]
MNDIPESDRPESENQDAENREAEALHEEEPVESPGVISQAFLARFIGAIGDGDRHYLRRTITEMHPADAADVLESLPEDALIKAVHLLDRDLPAETITELNDDVRWTVLEELSDAAIAAMTENLDSDDASFILNDLDEERRTRILSRVPASDRAAIETSLSFDEESAGRLMQRDFVAAPVFWTVGQTIDHMRSVDEDDLPETFFEIYTVDPAFRLQGSVSLSTLLRSARETPLEQIMKEINVRVRPEMDQEEVAYIFQQYNLASAPVVDEAGRLTGMITIDDMVDVIQEENREDILAMSGVSEAGVNQSVVSAVRARVPWLAVNLGTAFCGALVISVFQGAIQELVALAILMPVVAGLSGNAGSQAMAVAVRSIAERDLEGPLVARAVRREALTALANGLIIASLTALVAWLWFHNPGLALVAGAAMIFNFTWAGLIGILAPLILKRLKLDPAVASSVFVLTSIDLMGFFLFFGLATIFLL